MLLLTQGRRPSTSMTDKLPVTATSVPGFDQLSPREQMFVQHPDVYRDPMKAAQECGYSSHIVLKKSHSMRKRLMRFIQPAFEAEMKEIGVDRRLVELELAGIAFVDITEYQETIDVELADGGFQSVTVWKDPRTLPARMRRAISAVVWGSETLADGIVIQSDRPVSIRFHSKDKALKELAGLFGDVAPKNPQDEQQRLFDNLDDSERAVMIKLWSRAAKRAAGQTTTIEGEHAEPPSIRKPETPSPRRSEPVRRERDGGGEAPRRPVPDTPSPPAVRRLGAPRTGRGRADAPDDADSDAGYREIPD